MRILPMLFGAFQPLKPAPGEPATPWGREQELLASCPVRWKNEKITAPPLKQRAPTKLRPLLIEALVAGRPIPFPETPMTPQTAPVSRSSAL
jgi:hypothetical protein